MRMALSKSTDNSSVDFYEYRNITYYNRYKYRATLHTDFANIFSRLKSGRLISSGKDSHNYAKYKKLYELAKTMLDQKIGVTRSEGKRVSFFSDDLSFLLDIKKLGFDNLEITEAILGNVAGTKYFSRKPKHNYRIYLKSKPIAKKEVIELYEIIKRFDNVSTSPSMAVWLYRHNMKNNIVNYVYSSATFYIDYDDESFYSYIQLMLGEYLGHQYKLEQKPS